MGVLIGVALLLLGWEGVYAHEIGGSTRAEKRRHWEFHFEAFRERPS